MLGETIEALAEGVGAARYEVVAAGFLHGIAVYRTYGS